MGKHRNKYPRPKDALHPRAALDKRRYDQRGLIAECFAMINREREEAKALRLDGKSEKALRKHLKWRAKNVSTFKLPWWRNQLDKELRERGLLSKSFGVHVHLRLTYKAREMLSSLDKCG
jgi:hypothetical protein